MYEENPDFLALKEWNVVVEALLRGELAFLIRKGGIHESANRFLAEARQFWLYPTYEHQFEEAADSLLREPWATRLRESRRIYREGPSPHTPEWLEIRGYAKADDVFELWTEHSVKVLSEWGVWTLEFVEKRLRWKPRQPLVVFVLQTYRLSSPLTVRSDDAPRRCRSWLEIPFALGDYPGEAVVCSSREEVRRLCEERLASEEEAQARLVQRVLI